MTDSVVRTGNGAVRGEAADGVAVFRGIPYAAAPMGPLRFRPPVRPERWDGVRDAVGFGTAPPQRPPAPGVPPIWRAGDGLDCLTLNVWSPELFVTMASDALVRMPTLRTAEAHAGAGGRTWLYDLAWREPALGAAHGVDVPLVFGTGTTRYAARLLGAPPPEGHAALAQRMRTAWVSFATTGDPGWPRYDAGGRVTRIWDAAPHDDADPLAGSRLIWEKIGR